MFDINGARQAGYSENEIADFMAQQRGFNISGAREAGYSDNEILSHLDSLQSTDRSFKEIGLDTVKQLGVGVGSTIEGLGTVGMLLGSDRAKSMKDLGNKITEDLRGSYSQGLKNNISEQQQYINKADGEASKFWRTIESTATNPALLATFIAESAPQMLAGGVVGRGVGAGAKLLGAGEALAGKMAIGGAMGTGAVLQGADSASNTYDTLMKLDDGVWSQNQQFKALVEQGADPLQAKDEISKSLARKTLATSGAISLATQGAFSKIGGNAFERALVGQAEKGTVGGIAGKALAEAGSEAIEEGSGQGASNYNVNQVTPTSLFKNVGQSAGQGAITGFTMGGFGGAVEAFKPMTQLVEEEKAKIQAESGNVNAVNNSFNVFGDLAQRSDAINPNIGDINYNQFTQSVDNTTTTPTNTVNVPNVESLDQEIKRAEFYLRSLIGTGAKEEDIKIAQDRIEELKQKSKQQAQEAPTTEKPKDNRLNISDNSLMNFGELQNSELTQGVFANNDWQILKDKGYIETVRNENGDTYEAVTQEGRQALHNERDIRHLEEMNKSETIDDQISTAEQGVRSVGNRIKYYKDIINDELSTDEQKEIAQKSLNRDEKRLQEAYDKLNNLKKQRDLQKKEAVSKMETTETPQSNNGEANKEAKKNTKEQVVRTADEYGYVNDGLGGIKAGDVFRTASGRLTTPFPKQKQEIYATKWTIENAIAEAEARGDKFNATQFRALDPKNFTLADSQATNYYLHGENQPTVQKPFLKPLNVASDKSVEAKLAKAEAMEKQAMQNGDLETAKKVSEAKQGLELQQLQSHPRYQELMDMRKDIASKDTQYSQKLLQPRDIRTVNNGKGNDLEVTGALYTPNYASDFELTKADVKALQSGKATPKIIQKLKSDLGRLDNDPQYKLPEDEQMAKDGLMFSKEDEKDLIVQHNLSEDNLNYALKNGGLAVPSLAITKKGTPLTGFGEISLLGDKNLADPKGTAGTRVFGADIYSPRHPREEREYKSSDIRKMDKELSPYSTKLRDGSINESRDIKDLYYNKALQMKFLEEEKGMKLEVPTKKNPNEEEIARLYPEEYKKSLENKGLDWQTLYKDENFRQKVINDLSEKLKARGKDTDVFKAYGGDWGINNMAKDRAMTIDQIGRSKGQPDYYAMRDLLRKEIEKHSQEYKDYVDKFTSPYDYKSYFYDGNSRKQYNQDTVLKYLIKNLRGGENWNYGAGNVRAMVTPEFKSIKEIKSAKDRLITDKEFDEIKDSMNNELLSIAGEIASKDISNKFTANDIATKFIQDYAKRGKRAISDYEVNATSENLKRIDEFLNKLKEAPTEYFEAKITRIAQPSEFHTAVVPDNASQKTLDALKKQGLNIKIYKSGDEADRARAIKEASEENDLAFSKGKSKGTTADKATKIVNKLLGNSKVRQDVEVVQSFDNLPNDIKKRMELMSIAYHGTPHNVDKFSTKYIGTGEGAQAYGYGLYFADSKEVAEWYRDTLKPYGHDNFIIDGKAYDRNDLTTAEVYAIRDILKDGYEQALETNEKWVKSKTNPKDIDLATLDAIKRLKGLSIKENKGNLYRVELKPKEEEYLLWDKPLDEQSLHVKEALQKELDMYRKSEGAKGAYVNNSSGEKLYKEFIYTYGSDKKASERLNELGIKGIKYLDGTSRGKGDGNHNYVIFNDDDVGTPELLQSADGVVRGVFDPKSGKAYLVSDTMAENEVKGVLLHELLHRAINNEVKRQSDKQGQTVSRLDAILGSKLEQVTADLKSLEAKGDKDVLEAVNKAKEAGTPKQHMLEETLAYLLQNQTNKYSTPLKEFLLKVATAIKDFAKRVAVKMGIEPNWLASQITADDIANVLKSYALDDGSAKTSGEPMMSKIRDRMKRLMEWHKDSAPETKNADGTPKVFYHESDNVFNNFDKNKIGSKTDGGFYGKGFYFDENTNNGYYGKNTYPVYLNIKNPFKASTNKGYADEIYNFANSLYRNKNDRLSRIGKRWFKIAIDKVDNLRASDIKEMGNGEFKYRIDKDGVKGFGNTKEDAISQYFYNSSDIKSVEQFIKKIGSSKFSEQLKDAGYDGIKFDNEIIAFEPTQIKSVFNKGTFDESNPNILFSRTDDVNKLAKQARSKAKQFLSDQLNKTALERSIDMLSKPKDEAYSAFKSLVMNTLPQKYMDALGEMHKSKNRIEQQVGVVKASLSTLSLEQRTQLHDYIVNDVKTIDPELKKLADKISGIITNLGQELIDKGILEAHVVKAWEGKFLKRQFKNEEAVLGTSKFKTYFFGSKKSLAKQYTRGLQLQAETEAEAIKAINGYLKAYGHDEISGMGVNEAIKYLKDNGLFADGVQWKSDGKIKVREMKNGEYEIIRDFTKAEREKMEEVTDAGITVPDTILRLSTLLEHGKMLKATTELNDYVTDDKTMGNSMKWTQIENKPQYGVLAGKWVRPDIASDIIANQNAFYERDGLVDTWLKGLSLWKKSRTVWSPTGHFNNFVSNLFIKHGLGLDPFKNTLEAGKMLSQLQEYEALEVKDAMGTLTAEEKTKFKTMKSYLSSAIELRDNGMLGHTQLLDINRGFEQDGITEEKGALGKLDDAVSKLYKGGDTIHRLSSYMLIKEAGYDSETAMLVVDKLFPDYSKPMPKVWRWARDTGISPFISWTYYTLPAISKITMANPARTLGAYSALGAIGFLGMLLGSDGDWEEAIQSFLNLPEDAIGRRMPIWKNDKGEVLTWKVDRLMPFMDLASPLLGMASGAVKGYKESQGDVGHTAIKAVSGGFGGAGNTVRSYFAGPTINALLFNTAGKDSYTNNDIVKKDATDKQRMYLTAKYLVEQYAPLPTPLMRMYDMTEAMVKGEDERKRNAITVPRSPIENVIGLAGINVLRYDQKALDKQMKDFSAEAQDFTEIKQKLTKLDGMLKESKERKDIDTYNKIISKHQDEMRTLGDLKKTETQLRKLKSMRDEAMMSSDDKAVLELNKQINQIMKAFNERNKK